MAQNLNVTELDFDQIKDNLKNFLKQQSEFNDYNFEGSGLSTLLDVLAYNTHYNAVAAHYSLNEAFLDSAQIRGNVVTRAKLLGYVPRSVIAPRATISISVDATASAPEQRPTELTLPRGTKFTTTVQGESYDYIALDSHTVTISSNNEFVFNDVEIAEGTYKTVQYRVDNDIESQKFQIPDIEADISTLRVRIQANEKSAASDMYNRFESLLNLDSSSKIYYIQENTSEKYEVYFGDNVIGAKPENNNVVTLDYVYTHGPESNGADSFQFTGTLAKPDGQQLVEATYSTPTSIAAAGSGAIRESIESIRFNAPLTFTAQNRAVTSDDYRAIILKSFANIASISTWGGEDNEPVDFGRVYICIKPLTEAVLTQQEKDTIINSVLKGKNIVSITPEIVDPNFTNLELDVFFKYNPNLTDRSSAGLQGIIRDTISDYNFNQLNKFDGVFRYSQLLNLIDSADRSVLNSTVRPYMFKNISAKTDISKNDFTLSFASPIFQAGESTEHVIKSTPFNINGVANYFGDVPIDGSTDRRVIAYRIVGGKNITTLNDVGKITPAAGLVRINNFIIDADTEIKITVTPNSLDIAPKRDQLLNIDQTYVTITPEVDTIATGGASGTIDYTTNSRLR
jgi:hypothetical protein